MGKDPFTFSQFKRQKELEKLRKKARGEASQLDVDPPADGKQRKVYKGSVKRKPDAPK